MKVTMQEGCAKHSKDLKSELIEAMANAYGFTQWRIEDCQYLRKGDLYLLKYQQTRWQNPCIVALIPREGQGRYLVSKIMNLYGNPLPSKIQVNRNVNRIKFEFDTGATQIFDLVL